MNHTPEEINRLRELFHKYHYYPVDSSLGLDKLVGLTLYRKVTIKGKVSYILFHKKGSPINDKLPGSLYIAEEEMDVFLELSSQIVPDEIPELEPSNAGKLSVNFEEEVLNNPALDAEKKIELTLQCAEEVMKNIYDCSEIETRHIEDVKQLGENLNKFIQKVVRTGNVESRLLDKLIGHDYYTFSHCIHVSLYAGILAGELSEQDGAIPELDTRHLCLGALLHDIGKIRIDRAIINKNGRLTREEFEEIKKHPTHGARIVAEAREHPNVLCVIEQHHERWVGGGYPYNIRGEQIALSSRLASICDVFDALTTNRTYRPALKPFDALSMMLHGMAENFFPPYLRLFIKFLGHKTR